MEIKESPAIDAELSQLSAMYDGRIMLIDNNFMIIWDTERILPVACRNAAEYILMSLVEKVEELLIILRLFVFNLQN